VADNAWERFATSDAEAYICTELDRSASDDRESFFASGQAYVEHMLAAVGPYLGRTGSALEFGCGVGRLTIPVAKHFDRVTAVDVAPTMLVKLASNCEEFGVRNCTSFLSHEAWEQGGPFDLVYSFLVFQHLPNTTSVAAYLKRMANCLAADGICHLQFDTRPRSPGYRLRNALPDPVLPRQWRAGIRRIRRSPAEVHAMLAAAGLDPVEERGRGTALHEVQARKAVGDPA